MNERVKKIILNLRTNKYINARLENILKYYIVSSFSERYEAAFGICDTTTKDER